MADCCETIDNIAKQCGSGNSPGLKTKAQITCVDQIASIPAPGEGTHVISSNITMRSAVTGPPAITAGLFFEWNISKIDSELVSEPDGDGENVSFKHSTKFFINKLQPGITYIMNGMLGGEYIVIVKDRNGNQRLLGELDNGCTIKVKEQTNPKNGYEVTIEWESNYLPYYYTGTIVS
jgi:hypothetical protein